MNLQNPITGETPLHYALKTHQPFNGFFSKSCDEDPLVLVLLSRGADLSIPDKQGITPRDLLPDYYLSIDPHRQLELPKEALSIFGKPKELNVLAKKNLERDEFFTGSHGGHTLPGFGFGRGTAPGLFGTAPGLGFGFGPTPGLFGTAPGFGSSFSFSRQQ